MQCLCSFSCIIVHHYSLGESDRWVRPKTPMCATQRKRSKKSVWHLKLQVSSLLNYTCGNIFIKSSCSIHPSSRCAILIEIFLQQSSRCRNIGCWILVENWLLCMKQLSRTTVSIISHTTAAAGAQVEVAIEYNPHWNPAVFHVQYLYVLLILAGQLKMDQTIMLRRGSVDLKLYIWGTLNLF